MREKGRVEEVLLPFGMQAAVAEGTILVCSTCLYVTILVIIIIIPKNILTTTV